MRMRASLELMPKEEFENYVKIGCDVFGDILLQAMGFGSGCAGLYLREGGWIDIDQVEDDGDIYRHTVHYDDVRKSLIGKSLTLTATVTTETCE